MEPLWVGPMPAHSMLGLFVDSWVPDSLFLGRDVYSIKGGHLIFLSLLVGHQQNPLNEIVDFLTI